MNDVVHVGTPPQREEEIAPFRALLQALDPLLNLRWNAEAFVQKYGSIDAKGRPSQPKFEGRWEVIRFGTDRLHLERDYAVIMMVTLIDPPKGARKYPIMAFEGPYMPIDQRIVDYVQLCDRAQGRLAAEATKEAWDTHDQATQLTDDRAAHQEAAEKVYSTHGGAYWMGGAQGKADPETAKALWPSPTTP